MHQDKRGELMKEFYNSNADFKNYVDKYCKKHKCSIEEAMKHKLIEAVYEQYKENNKPDS